MITKVYITIEDDEGNRIVRVTTPIKIEKAKFDLLKEMYKKMLEIEYHRLKEEKYG